MTLSVPVKSSMAALRSMARELVVLTVVKAELKGNRIGVAVSCTNAMDATTEPEPPAEPTVTRAREDVNWR